MAKFTDVYSIQTEANVGPLNKVVDALKNTGDETKRLGDQAQRASGDVDKANRSIADIDDRAEQASDAVDRMRRSAEEGADGVRDLGDESEQTSGLLDKLRGMAGLAAKAVAGISLVGILGLAGGLAGLVSDITGADAAMNHFGAQTGIYGEELEEYQAVAQNLFTDGLGENFDAVLAAMGQARALTDLEGQSLEALTRRGLVFSDVFDRDINESLRAADTAAENFGGNASKMLDLVAAGMQRTGDPADDLLDTFNEYSANFAQLGFEAPEMLGILESGLEAGARNTDDIADGVREFGIRLKEGASDTALWALGLDGLNAEFRAGKASGEDMFNAVIEGLRDIEDPLERNRLGVELFGTKWEDVGEQVFLALDPGEEKLSDFAGTLTEAQNNMQRGLGPAVERFQRTIRVGLANALSPYVETFVRQMIPAMEQFALWLQNVGLPFLVAFLDRIAQGVGDVIDFIDSFGGFDFIAVTFVTLADYAGQFVDFLANLSPESLAAIGATLAVIAGPAVIGAVIGGLSTIIGLVTSSVMANPLLLVALAGIAAYETNFGGMRDAIDGMVSAFKEGDLAGGFTELGNALLAIPKGIADSLGQAVFGWESGEMQKRLDTWKEIPPMIGEIASKLAELSLDKLKDIAGDIDDKLVQPVKDAVGDVIGFFVGGGARDAATSLQAGLEQVPTIITNALGDLFAPVNDALVTPIANAISSVVALFVGGGGRDAATSLKAAVEQAPTIITNALSGLAGTVIESLYNPFVNAVADIVSIFIGEDNADSLRSTLLGLPEQLGEWFTATIEAAKQFGIDFVTGVLDGLKGFGQDFIDALKKELSGVKDAELLPGSGLSINNALDLVGFADGGIMDGLALVGEEGPELAFTNQPTAILSHQNSVKAIRDALMIPAQINVQRSAAGGSGGQMVFHGDLHFHGVQNVRQLRDELGKEARRQNKHGGREK